MKPELTCLKVATNTALTDEKQFVFKHSGKGEKIDCGLWGRKQPKMKVRVKSQRRIG
jgi:hypothetical protein